MTLPDPGAWPVTDPVADPSRDLLCERADSTPGATALVAVDSDETWTYAAFDERVSRVARRLAAHSADSDGRVGLLLDTGTAFATLAFATARLPASLVPLNVDQPAERLRSQADRADLRCLVCDDSTRALAEDVTPPGVTVVPVDRLIDRSDPEETSAASAAFAGATPLDRERLLLFTSGTTGDPKGVRLTRRNLVASAVGSADRLGVAPGDRWLVCLPMYHMGGFAPLVRSTLYGTTTVIQRSFDAERTQAVIADRDVTGVSLVPTMLTRLLDAGWAPPESLRFVLLGGAPASVPLLDRAFDRGVPVYPTYGATETASQVSTATPAEASECPGTVGRPIRGTAVSIRADDGSALEPGQRGEIVVSGPTVTPGYLDDDQTAVAFGPDGFHTGDVGCRDADGRLWVVGRFDDRIVTGGENVQPATVVAALTDLDDVTDAAVVGLPDEEWGERVAALVVPARPGVTREAVLEGVRERLADFAVPKTLAFAETLPRTASGTVDRDTVAARLDADDADR